MEIFDKAQWHIDAGMDSKKVVEKLNNVFSFLNENDMLSEEGIELFKDEIDSSISLNEKIVNEKGRLFLRICYDAVIDEDANNIKKALNEKLSDIKKIVKLIDK